MPIITVKSGLIQTIQPQNRNELIQIAGAIESAKGADIQHSLKDPASQFAIPDIPTTEAPYDGHVAFGTFISDKDLNG